MPAEICWRKDKGDLSYGFHHALLHGDMKIVDDICFYGYGGVEKFVDVVQLQKTVSHYRSTPNNRDGIVLWRVVVLARWLRRSGFG